MKRNQKKSDKVASLSTEKYIAPDIEIIDIELEQNIFAGSTGPLPNMPGDAW